MAFSDPCHWTACPHHPITGRAARIAVRTGEFCMRIAITGATGFLGRYLVRHLADGGHQLRCWYRPGSDRSGFESQADAIEWLPGSLGEESATQELVRGVDAVVHAAL